MANGNHFIITSVGQFLGQAMVNVWVYEQITGPDNGANAISLAWTAAIPPITTPFQNHAYDWQSFNTINFENPADYQAGVLTDVGAITGDALPPYDCFAFLYQRATRAVRNGHKRIGGVSESSQVSGVVGDDILLLMEAAALVYEAPLTDDDGGFWLPRIWRRASPATTKHAAWPDSFHPISAVQRQNHVSTQNSRKFGHGI